MAWIVAHMKWIMLVSGSLTCTMLYAAIAPQAALRGTFGHTLEGPIADIVIRSWGILIGLMGAMLIYGAFHTSTRPLILTIVGISKVTFILLILGLGRQFLGNQAGTAVVSDTIQVGLFAGYLLASKGARRTAEAVS